MTLDLARWREGRQVILRVTAHAKVLEAHGGFDGQKLSEALKPFRGTPDWWLACAMLFLVARTYPLYVWQEEASWADVYWLLRRARGVRCWLCWVVWKLNDAIHDRIAKKIHPDRYWT